jgi:hypothetical protein
MTSELKPSPRARFRTKEREIEAVQFHGCGYYEARGLAYPEGVCFCDEGKVISDTSHAHVHTMHGQIVLLAVDDWISPEPDGSGFYPIKPSVFEARYEPARTPVPDKQLTDVVEKCRDRFAEYVELHRAKLTDDAVLNVREAIWRKVEHNQEMVRMCDEALASLNTAPAVDDVVEAMTLVLLDIAKAYGLGTPESRAIVTATDHARAALKATTHTEEKAGE